MKALVVDDSRASLSIVTALLTQLGYDVAQAVDGKIALNLFIHGDFELVVMDFQMPGLTGAESISVMRTHEADQKKTPAVIIAVSGNSNPAVVLANMSAGANRFLTKPFSLDQLKKCLEEETAKKRQL